MNLIIDSTEILCYVIKVQNIWIERGDKLKINERISQYIRNAGLKQKVVAEKAGYSEKQLSAMLRGTRKIWADDYERICVALGKEPNDFMSVSGQDQTQQAEERR